MKEESSIYDDFDKSKVDEWDFDKNIDIDILQEPANSKKEANWICSNCGYEYKEKINCHMQYNCPQCGEEMLLKTLKNYKKEKKRFLIKNYIYIIIISFILPFLQYGVTFEWKTITKDLIAILLFFVIILLELTSICIIIEQIKFNKDKQLIKIRYSLYNLFKQCNDINVVKKYYIKTIEDRLIFLIERNGSNPDKKDVLDMFKYESTKNFNNFVVNKKSKSEFNCLLSIYRDDSYFYKLYSTFENKQLIDFSNKQNLKILMINIAMTIISLFLSIYYTIENWNIFKREIFFAIIPSIVIIILMLFDYKLRKRSMINDYKFDLIYISSAIAKIKNEEEM